MTDAAPAYRALADRLLDRYPDEAARVLERTPVAEAVAALERENPSAAAEHLGRISPDAGAAIVEALGADGLRAVFTELNLNRAAALLARLDDERRAERLAALEPSTARELETLLQYPPESAGNLMNPRVLGFRGHATVEDVLERLRALRHRRVQDLFVVDAEGRLAGWVALEDLVLASPGERLDALSRGACPCVQATSPRDEVMEILDQHRVRTLPVVDYDNRLLGVLRQEELVRAAQAEATDDLVTMVGASREERALSSPWFAVRKRLPWLEINLVTAFLAAAVVGLFEGTIARFTALAVLLPVVAGQSGNTGAQALAVTMRGLALREVRVRQWGRVAVKEVTVGALNGVAVAITTSLAVLVWSRSPGLALVIGTSMVLSMVAAGFAGAVIPMALTKLGQDPAQSSSIVLTTITDVTGFFSFLGIATALSGML